MEGPDFTGLPDKSNDSGITRYLAPQFLPTQKAIDEGLFPEKGLLVFEEINRVPGGELRIEKKLFIREMLRPDSVMKHLLNYNLEDHGKTRSLKIDKSDANQVVINFNFVDKVGVGEDYQALLENLKKDLQGRIQGSVTLTIDAYYEAMYLTIDFNSDDGHISQNF